MLAYVCNYIFLLPLCYAGGGCKHELHLRCRGWSYNSYWRMVAEGWQGVYGEDDEGQRGINYFKPPQGLEQLFIYTATTSE